MLDAGGVFGQVARVGQLTSEVILVSDAAHAIPVQINRNGLRTMAVGTGDTSRLKLPYLPTSADVVAGDLLVTSGLGGGFPAGYPVGTVAEVKRDPAQSLADVDVKPAAALDRSRELHVRLAETAGGGTRRISRRPNRRRRRGSRRNDARERESAACPWRCRRWWRSRWRYCRCRRCSKHSVPTFWCWWCFTGRIESPRAGGLTLAFFSGLALDVIHGVVLGQHALALTLMAAWATHLRLRIRVFSMLSQCLDDVRAADRLSVRAVLGRRRHRQSR